MREDFEVMVAENGLQALQIVASHSVDYFDVIVLDIDMPIMDGKEACQRIHQYLHKKLTKFPEHVLDSNQVKQYEEDVVTQTMLYALTADISMGTKAEVSSLPFEAVFERICVEEIAMIKR